MSSAHPDRKARRGDGPPDVDSWVFDVDGCLVDSLTGTSLRPGARELLGHLGRVSRVILWSAGGGDYARGRAEQFGVDGHVSDDFPKEGRDTGSLPHGAPPGRTRAVPCSSTTGPRIWPRARGAAVSPYLSEDAHDRGLAVARRAGLSSCGNR